MLVCVVVMVINASGVHTNFSTTAASATTYMYACMRVCVWAGAAQFMTTPRTEYRASKEKNIFNFQCNSRVYIKEEATCCCSSGKEEAACCTCF